MRKLFSSKFSVCGGGGKVLMVDEMDSEFNTHTRVRKVSEGNGRYRSVEKMFQATGELLMTNDKWPSTQRITANQDSGWKSLQVSAWRGDRQAGSIHDVKLANRGLT